MPDMTYQVYKHLKRVSSLIVTNAADSSSRVRTITLSFSVLRLMSISTFKSAVSVE